MYIISTTVFIAVAIGLAMASALADVELATSQELKQCGFA